MKIIISILLAASISQVQAESKAVLLKRDRTGHYFDAAPRKGWKSPLALQLLSRSGTRVEFWTAQRMPNSRMKYLPNSIETNLRFKFRSLDGKAHKVFMSGIMTEYSGGKNGKGQSVRNLIKYPHSVKPGKPERVLVPLYNNILPKVEGMVGRRGLPLRLSVIGRVNKTLMRWRTPVFYVK